MTSPLVIPELAAVYDAASNRELLFAPQPLEVQVAAKSQVAILRLQNGPDGDLELTISADQTWIHAEPNTLELPPNGAAEIRLKVGPDGSEEFALLELSWPTADGDVTEHILVRRLRPASATPVVPTPKQARAAPTSPPPPPPKPVAGANDWMLDHLE